MSLGMNSNLQLSFLDKMARERLLHEISRPSCNLRIIVGHANLLDALALLIYHR